MMERMEESNTGTTGKPASFAASYYSNGINLRAEVLSGFVLFERIPTEDFATIVATAYQSTYSPNKTMLFEGDPILQGDLPDFRQYEVVANGSLGSGSHPTSGWAR
jgi:hypothetical protein